MFRGTVGVHLDHGSHSHDREVCSGLGLTGHTWPLTAFPLPLVALHDRVPLDALRHAVQSWEQLIGRPVFLLPQRQNSPVHSPGTAWMSFGVLDHALPGRPHARAYTDKSLAPDGHLYTARILLLPPAFQALEVTLLHELGHALGLAHVMDAQATMFAHAPPSTRLTLADRSAILRLYPAFH